MRLLAFTSLLTATLPRAAIFAAAVLASAPLAAQTIPADPTPASPPSAGRTATLTPEPRAETRTPQALARLPTERFGAEWGMTRADVAARVGRAPDADEAPGDGTRALTYLGRSGGQTIWIFEPDATGTDRLTTVVEASPAMVHLQDALAEADQYKAALIARYGAPLIEDSPRAETAGDEYPVVDTVWVPHGDERAVELTVDHVVTESGAVGHIFYVRTSAAPGATGPEPRP